MAITKTGSQLLKIASRWHDFIAKLSPENQKKIFNAGLVKPVQDYIAGINRGTENIANRAGFKISDLYGKDKNSPLARIRGSRGYRKASTDLATNTIDTTFQDPSFFKDQESADMLRAIQNRHEADEAMAAFKAQLRLANNYKKSKKTIVQNAKKQMPHLKATGDGMIFSVVSGEPAWVAQLNTKHTGQLLGKGPKGTFQINNHGDIDVLTKERKLMDRIPYRQNKGLRHWQRVRRMTGETQYLNNSGGYNPNSLERYNKANANKTYAYGKNPQTPIKINGGYIQEISPWF